MTLIPAVAQPGDIVTLKLEAPADFIWGRDLYLEVDRDGEWDRIFLLWNDPAQSPNGFAAFDNANWPKGIAVRGRGYRGDSELQLKLPQRLESGTYRVVKSFIRQGDLPAEDRTVTRTVRLEIR